MTFIFTILFEYLLNEDSKFCCLPEEFQNYHISLLENEDKNKEEVSDEDITKAKDVLDRAKKQKKTIDLKVYFDMVEIRHDQCLL
jgi:hypothetical protein